MKSIKETAEAYNEFFETNERSTGETFYYLVDSQPEELSEAVREAHESQLPNDWIFHKFTDLLYKVTEYDCADIEALEDVRHEIVDSCVDIYTHDLTAWLHENQALEYLEDACVGFVKEDGAWQLLARAQYNAIDEVMRCVISLLNKE